MTDLIGYLAGAFLAISFLPQVWQSWTTRQVDDVSVGMIVLTLLSAILYEVYSILLGLWPVVIMNGIFTGLVATQLVLKFAFASSPSVEDEPKKTDDLPSV